MKLYLISTSRELEDRDLFVWADDRAHALRLWTKHYELAAVEDVSDVFEIPTTEPTEAYALWWHRDVRVVEP